jgi:cellobiose PTS system EIIB component
MALFFITKTKVENRFCQKRRNEMNHTIRLLVICSWGATSSVLCQKINETAFKKGIALRAKAVGVKDWSEHLQSADLIMIEPQISHLRNEIEPVAKAHRKPFAQVDPVAFATMNGDQLLKQAALLLSTYRSLHGTE